MVPISPYAVQGAVMGLFPLPDTFSAKTKQRAAEPPPPSTRTGTEVPFA